MTLRQKIENLAFDINTLKWVGHDKGWDLACDRLRKELFLILEDTAQQDCSTCKHCSKVFEYSIQCDLFQCYQQNALKYCGNWEAKDDYISYN